jgi:uroporphyrinogen decarboxylase
MTRRERVVAALRHAEPDWVPYQVDFTAEARAKTAAYYGDPGFETRIGNHLANVMYAVYDATHREVRPGFFQDHFGVVWNRTIDKDIGNVDGLLLPEPRLAGYRFPEVDGEFYRGIYRPFVASNPEVFRFGAIGFSLFERAWTLMGMENLLIDMVENPSFVEELLDLITEYDLGVIRVALEFDIDGVHFGDDWGQQRGTIMGPAAWRRFIKPRLARLYAEVKKAGKFVSQHSCGDVRELFPDLIDIGLDIFNTFQPEIMDPAETKRKYGKHLTFWGGISTQTLLPWKTPGEVRETVARLCRVVGERGGYIAAPTHDVPKDVPVENIVAMIETLRAQAG